MTRSSFLMRIFFSSSVIGSMRSLRTTQGKSCSACAFRSIARALLSLTFKLTFASDLSISCAPFHHSSIPSHLLFIIACTLLLTYLHHHYSLSLHVSHQPLSSSMINLLLIIIRSWPLPNTTSSHHMQPTLISQGKSSTTIM